MQPGFSCVNRTQPTGQEAPPRARDSGARRIRATSSAKASAMSDFEAWFENHVKPALPEGAPAPSITFDELNDVRLAVKRLAGLG